MNTALRHPENAELLRYADGELSPRAASQVRSHLEACWECRVELDELQQTVAGCVRYRKEILQRLLPPPPAPWSDIYRGFAAIDASVEPAFFSGVRRALAQLLGGPRQWAIAAAAIALLCAVFYRFNQPPSVRAAELLRKAAMVESAHASRPRRIRIGTRNHSIIRATGLQSSPRLTAADTATLSSIEALFHAADYDWQDPLSATSYKAWHDRVSDRRDEVSEDKDTYHIITDTDSGALAQATLTLRTADLHPIAERFQFRSREWVEIEEVPEEETPVLPERAASIPVKPSTQAPAPKSATIADELHVLEALHAVRADLGDPIEISRTDGRVLVTGLGIAPQRQKQISQALSSQPEVVVRFLDSAPLRALPESSATDTPSTGELSQVQARIAEQLGGRANFEQTASELLDLSEPMISRAYALRRLAAQFPAGIEAQLSAEDRRVLVNLRSEHTAALRRQTAEIDRSLKPVLPLAGGAPLAVTLSSPWQQATEELFQSARRVEKLLAVLFGAAPGEQLPEELQSSLARLRGTIEAYDRLSK